MEDDMFTLPKNDVRRFRVAQGNGAYERALGELLAGRKEGHWIWFVFPQVRGLGFSWAADYYGIGSWEEAEAYIANETLAGRLAEVSQALIDLGQSNPEAILGGIDALKVRSSMTLFEQVSDDPVFGNVLMQYYGNERDPLTLKIVEDFPTHNVVFLDFDGVMQADYEKGHTISSEEFCNLKQWAANAYSDDGYLQVGNDDIAAVLHDWTEEAVESVERIARNADARIVISSSWRYYDDDESLMRLLALRSLDKYFEGALSRELNITREDAIRAYIADHPCSIHNFVALDDMELRGLDGHFFQVRSGSLTAANADEAIRILQDQQG